MTDQILDRRLLLGMAAFAPAMTVLAANGAMAADKAALAAHMQAPNIQAFGAKASDMIAKPPAQSLLKILSTS